MAEYLSIFAFKREVVPRSEPQPTPWQPDPEPEFESAYARKPSTQCELGKGAQCKYPMIAKAPYMAPAIPRQKLEDRLRWRPYFPSVFDQKETTRPEYEHFHEEFPEHFEPSSVPQPPSPRYFPEPSFQSIFTSKNVTSALRPPKASSIKTSATLFGAGVLDVQKKPTKWQLDQQTKGKQRSGFSVRPISPGLTDAIRKIGLPIAAVTTPAYRLRQNVLDKMAGKPLSAQAQTELRQHASKVAEALRRSAPKGQQKALFAMADSIESQAYSLDVQRDILWGKYFLDILNYADWAPQFVRGNQRPVNIPSGRAEIFQADVTFVHDDERMTGSRATGESYEPSFFQVNFDRQGQTQVQNPIAFHDTPAAPDPDFANRIKHRQTVAYTDSSRFVEGVQEAVTATAVHTSFTGTLASSVPSEAAFAIPRYVRAGDINGDGQLNIVDLHNLLAMMSDPSILNDPMGFVPLAADVNQDGLRFNALTSEITGKPHLTQEDVAILSMEIKNP